MRARYLLPLFGRQQMLRLVRNDKLARTARLLFHRERLERYEPAAIGLLLQVVSVLFVLHYGFQQRGQSVLFRREAG